jgi:hypothetical protein
MGPRSAEALPCPIASFGRLLQQKHTKERFTAGREVPPRCCRYHGRARTLNPRLPSAAMVDWSRPLTRVLILKTDERLRTLHDTAELITRRFGSVTKSAPLEHAISLLLRAVETGTRADRKVATNQVALVLRFNVMMD